MTGVEQSVEHIIQSMTPIMLTFLKSNSLEGHDKEEVGEKFSSKENPVKAAVMKFFNRGVYVYFLTHKDKKTKLDVKGVRGPSNMARKPGE